MLPWPLVGANVLGVAVAAVVDDGIKGMVVFDEVLMAVVVVAVDITGVLSVKDVVVIVEADAVLDG